MGTGSASTRTPHLLYIAFYYPPSRASGVYRASATSRVFAEAGWDVTVITVDEAFFVETAGNVDRTLLDDLPPQVDVRRVRFRFPSARRQLTDLRTKSWLGANYHWVGRRIGRALAKLRAPLDVVRGRSRESFDLVDRYTDWIDPVVKEALGVHDEKPFHAILATGNPYSSFEAARLLKRMTGRPLGLDYRDPWALDVAHGAIVRRDDRTWVAERRILEEADLVAMVNEAMIDEYEELFPGVSAKAMTVFNGYDESSVGESMPCGDGRVRFGLLGTASQNWPLRPLFDGWRRLDPDLEVRPDIVFAGYLGYFEWNSGAVRDLFPSEEDGFTYVGPISKDRVAGFYSDCDAIILPSFGGAMIHGGKLFEIAAQGKPVLCIQGEGGGARKMMETHPLAVCVSPDPAEIANGIRRVLELCESVGEEERRAVRRQMERFERLTELRRLVRRFDDMIARPTST